MINAYVSTIAQAITDTPYLGDNIEYLIAKLRETNARGHRVFLIGNGGSAAIASHIAIDLCKNGGVRALALNDSSALTCLANDYGYVNVFSKQLEYHATPNDLLIAVSSSGNSSNIYTAAGYARTKGMYVVTLSGFDPENSLRKYGDINFYAPSDSYGVVENAHQIILHYIVDQLCEMRSR